MILEVAGFPSVRYNVTHQTSLVGGQCSTFTRLYHHARRRGTPRRNGLEKIKGLSVALFTKKEPLQFEK